MSHRASIERVVEFSETDMAGIVHFSNFYKWMESAESVFLRKYDVDFVERDADMFRGWPRVHASCDFKAPLKYGDKFEVIIVLHELRNHSLKFAFHFYKLEENDQKTEVAIGEMTTCYAKFNIHTQKIEASLISDEIRKKLTDHAEHKETNPALGF